MSFFIAGWPDTLTIVVGGIVVLVVLYYLILWIRTDKYSDSADSHALGCLRTLSWGCWLPLAVLGLLIFIIV